MLSILNTIADFFNPEPNLYAHRHRTIEKVALEKGLDIDVITADTKTILENEGRVEAILQLQKRFHVSLSVAWIFVDKLDKNNTNTNTNTL